ncbi:MAG: polysaccharide deacetylase family protein [Alphaproteobacteria bacterium]
MKVAFTIDDLPLWPNSYPPEGYTAAGIVEPIVETLDRHAIKGVYAFSNSWALLKHPELSALMDLWVDAGHHIANHTHSHPELNDVSAERYIEDIDLAEEHLAPWLSKAPKRYFRYTLNYWGNTQEKLSKVKAHLDMKGYTVAEVTSMLYEWEWNRAYKNLLLNSDKDGMAFLRQSFLDFCIAQIRYDSQCAKKWFGADFVGITLGHFIPFFADYADDLFTRLIDEGVQFISLEKATADPIYAEVCSVVSAEFLVYHQKLAHARGEPMPIVVPNFQSTYDKIEELAEGQGY